MTRLIAVFASVVVLILAVYAVGEHSRVNLYHSQIKACQRGNVLRRQNDQQVVGLQLQISVLREFIKSAAQARKAAYERDGHLTDKEAYEAYTDQYRALIGLHFDSSPQIDCSKAIHK